MPVLMKRFLLEAGPESKAHIATRPDLPVTMDHAKPASSLMPCCGNSKCKSSWLRIWRSRRSPVLEGKWACSQECMLQIVQAAILRESEGNAQRGMHQHRVPLGLILLSRGVITREQLKKALEVQRKAGAGRLGEWLIKHKAVDESHIARALSTQWNCPALASIPHDPVAMAPALPRLLIDSFGVVPLRLAGHKLLYVAFEDRIDRCLILAIERMLGLKVEAGILRESEFRQVRAEALRAPFPSTRLLEAANARGLAYAFTGMIEERKPLRSQIVRIHDYFWLRLWRNACAAEDAQIFPAIDDIDDMVCSLATR
jgi:hypothetical protein